MKNLILSLLIIIIYLTSCQQENKAFNPDTLFSVEQMQEDFAKLDNKLKRNHPFFFTNKRILDSYFDSTYALINDSKSLLDYYIILRRLVTKVNCGHTYLLLPENYWGNMLKYYNHFPFKLYYQYNKAYVLHNYSNDSTILPGTEIISVNNIAISGIVNNLVDIVSADGFNQTYKYHQMNQIDYGLFPGYTEFPESYKVKYIARDDTVVMDKIIEAGSYTEITDARKRILANRKKYKPYDFKIIDSMNTAVITTRDFGSFSKKDYQSFLKKSFKSVHEKAINNLIIDVRNNDGGDPYNATELISYLTDSDFVYFSNYVIGYNSLKRPIKPNKPGSKGNVYVLMNGGSFSTTGHFLSVVKYHNLGILIGEESGGSFICNGCNDDYTLPNSRFVLSYTRCTYRTKVWGFNRRHGIFPDYQVKPTIEGIVNNEDTVMLFTLAFIRKRMADK